MLGTDQAGQWRNAPMVPGQTMHFFAPAQRGPDFGGFKRLAQTQTQKGAQHESFSATYDSGARLPLDARKGRTRSRSKLFAGS